MAIQTTIDKAGRVVIPQDLRNALHLQGGDKLTIRMENGAIVIEPVRAKGRMKQRHGLWVYSAEGKPVTQEIANAAREKIHEDAV